MACLEAIIGSHPPLTPTEGILRASCKNLQSPLGLPVSSPPLNPASVPRFCRTPRPCLDSDCRSPRLINDMIGRHGASGVVSNQQEEDRLIDIKHMLMRHHAEIERQLNEWMTKQQKCLQQALGAFQDTLHAFQCNMANGSSIHVGSGASKSADQLASFGSMLLSLPQGLKHAATSNSSQTPSQCLGDMVHPAGYISEGSSAFRYSSTTSTDGEASPKSSKSTRYLSVDEIRTQTLMQSGLGSGHTRSRSFTQQKGPFQCFVDRMHSMVNNFFFELFFATLIVFNSVILGVEVAMASSSPKEELPHGFYYLSVIFTALFSAELVMRVIGEGGLISFFLYSEMRAWNWFDMIAVMCSLIEVSFGLVLLGGGSQAVTRIMRVARMTRLGRVLRVVRIVRVVSQLRELVISIVTSLQTLCWALFLLLIVIYIFAVLLAQATAEYFSEYPDNNLENLLDNDEPLAHYWGSLHAAMYTLFMSVAGGVSWEVVVLPIAEVHWIWGALFTSFIVFSSFSLINVMTAVFCQNAIESAQKSMDVKWQRMCADKRKHAENLKRLFKSLEKNTKGTISLKKLQKCWGEMAMQQFLLSMDLAPDDCWTFFSVLDANHDKEVDAEEFVEGCLHLKGNARAFDTAVMMYELRHLSKQTFSFMNQMQEDMRLLLTEPYRLIGGAWRSSSEMAGSGSLEEVACGVVM